MNWRTIWAITRKDLYEVTQNRSVWLPGLLFPLIVSVVIPVLVLLLAKLPPTPGKSEQLPAEAVRTLMTQMPAHLAESIQHLPPSQQTAIFMIGFLFAPMFLIIPLAMASIIGASAFVGEKERKTLEALLYTPATDSELMLGKLMAAVIPALVVSWMSFLIYTVVVNSASWPIMGQIWFPTATWWPLMLWVTPAIATLGIGVAVIVSAKAETFIEANQKTGILVLPLIALLAGQLSGVLFLSFGVSFLLGATFWTIDVLILLLSIRRFARSNLIGKL